MKARRARPGFGNRKRDVEEDVGKEGRNPHL